MDQVGDFAALFAKAMEAASIFNELGDLPGGKQFTVLPNGYSVKEFAPDIPNHIKQSVAFEDGDSFVYYVNEYKGLDGAAILLASVSNSDDMRISAVLNYHQPVSAAERSIHHADHTASFKPTYSEQYARWRALDEVAMTQDAFAAFVEEFAADVVEPSPAAMMEIARDLEMNIGMEFKSKTSVQSGLQTLIFVETGTAKTSSGVDVPKEFTIRVPVFFGEEPVDIPVFLRFRAQKGQPLRFAIKIRDRVTREKNAFLRAVSRIGEATQLTPMLGAVR